MSTANWRSKAGTTFQTEKRPVSGSKGVVVTNHPLGSAAGSEMLLAGGNAFDAAIASLFALTVVEPMMVGIFGAGHMNVRLANGENHVIDGYSTAPAACTETMYTPIADSGPEYLKSADDLSSIGYLAIGVPGTLKAWTEALEAWGTMSLAEVMAPAIRFAKRGFKASEYLHETIVQMRDIIQRFPATAATYMPGGAPLQPGDHVDRSDYSRTLSAIAENGPDYLYHGPLGEIVCDYLSRNGGIITKHDLANYRTVHRKPVRGDYRGYELFGPPPPSAAGVHITEMLNILEEFDVAEMGFGTPDSIHLLLEAMKKAFADRNRYTGDPEFVEVPVDRLIAKHNVEEFIDNLDMEKASPELYPGSNEPDHTTHLTVADADGNVVAATQTINELFGSKVTVPGTGMLLNNTQQMFDPHPGKALSVQPGKRVTSSMAPTIVLRDGFPEFAVGLPGGVRIFTSVFQAIVNLIDHRMTAQEAVEAPRVWTQGQDVEIEVGVAESVRAEVSAKGHRVTPVNAIGGGMNIVRFEPGGLLSGAACWRADGHAVGIGGGFARTGVRFRPTVGIDDDTSSESYDLAETSETNGEPK
ncbi:MAG: gamma-glutamyltransferase [Chloroflexi bacterium]|nr:gamma-glutamyltransferase [Chloroflexota bacterium]|tara:strand:- start:356 stop:2110 length:1755 start_codon:yes stop_codon:yes gene_type:complete